MPGDRRGFPVRCGRCPVAVTGASLTRTKPNVTLLTEAKVLANAHESVGREITGVVAEVKGELREF